MSHTAAEVGCVAVGESIEATVGTTHIIQFLLLKDSCNFDTAAFRFSTADQPCALQEHLVVSSPPGHTVLQC